MEATRTSTGHVSADIGERALSQTGPVHAEAEVVAQDQGNALLVRLASELLAARRAVSCLVAPMPGDKVLLSGARETGLWVIAVLESRNPGQQLLLDGDTRLVVRNGDLSLQSDKSIALDADSIGLRAKSTLNMLCERAVSTCAQWLGHIGLYRLVGKEMETAHKHVSMHAATTVRTTEISETVRAGHLDCQVEGVLELHGHATFMSGKTLLKFDSEQVHLG